MPGLNLTHEEARERSTTVRLNGYEVELDFTQGSETFGITAVLRFEAACCATTFLDFVGPAVESITLNGIPVEVGSSFDGARISLTELEEENVVEVRATGGYVNTGQGLHRYVDPVDNESYLYSQFAVADARRVFPVFDQPDIKGSLALTVRAPHHWTVLSNEESEVREDQDSLSRIHRFATTPPISSYLYAIIAGPYQGIRSELTSASGEVVPLGVYCRASLFDHLDGDHILEITRKGFEFYEDKFNYPYPFRKYDQIFVPEFNLGAMEHPGCVTFTDAYVFRGKVAEARIERRATTVLHELAHMWFGDLVTMTWWDDLWLNESFATYASTLCMAQSTWPPPHEHWSSSAWTTFAASEKWWAYRQDQLPSTHPVVATINDLEDVEVNFDGITYAKGASVLRQLAAYVGEEAFFTGINAYFTTHAWGNTTLKDFLGHLETASGRDLSAWSGQWLEQSGVNLIEVEVETTPDWDVMSFALLQKAPAENPVLRPHLLRVGQYDEAQDATGATVLRRAEVHDVDMPGRAEFTVRALEGTTRPLVFLPNDDDLSYAKLRLDSDSWTQSVQYLSRIEDSLARSLVWGIAWDRTRDGELSAQAHIDLVLNNISAETNSTVIQALLGQLDTCLTIYLPPSLRSKSRAEASRRLLGLTQASVEGSDLQYQLLRATLRHGADADVIKYLASLLAGDETLPGIVLDADLRWEVLICLTAARALPGLAESKDDRAFENHATTLIGEYLVTDQTSSGEVAALRATAAIPTPAAKRAAWEKVTTGAGDSNTAQAAVMAGLQRLNDPVLLIPFALEYFPAIEQLWRERSNKVAQRNVEGLFPMALAGHTLPDGETFASITASWLQGSATQPPALIRLIRENHDALSRSERVQRASGR